MKMDHSKTTPADTKEVFRQCGTCSQTFAHLLNRAFGYPQDEEERAIDLMAGGISNQGQQCGMLWGAALAAGAEAWRRCEDPDEAIPLALEATRQLLESFVAETGTVNCREIIGIDLSRAFGLLKFIVKTSLQGANNNPCYQLAERWAPEAIRAARAGLSGKPAGAGHAPLSCASELAKRMGGSVEEAAMVAGFAGGLGLSGEACGALSAAIWLKALRWCREHPGKAPPYFNNPQAKSVLKAFREAAGGEMRCREIAGRQFETLDEHAGFLRQGGCRELLAALAKA